MTQDTLKLANLETLIQQLHEFVGLASRGSVISSEINILPRLHTIDITVTAICARSWGMDQTMAGNHQPSPSKLDSQKRSLEISNRSIFGRFRPTSDGMDG